MFTRIRNLLFPIRATDSVNPDPGAYFTLQYEAERYRVVKILGVGKAGNKIIIGKKPGAVTGSKQNHT